MNAIHSCVRLLNQPLVKDGIKHAAGSISMVFGLIEIYDIYQIARGREVSTDDLSAYPKWVQVANKVVILCAKISLILSAGVSQPGIFIISTLAGCVFSTPQLTRAFGPYTTFVVNPWHPRHVISLVSVALALPSVCLTVYRGFHWAAKNHAGWLTDSKIRLMTLTETIFSRPILHLGNSLVRQFI